MKITFLRMFTEFKLQENGIILFFFFNGVPFHNEFL